MSNVVRGERMDDTKKVKEERMLCIEKCLKERKCPAT